VFENSVLRRIFGHKGEELAGDWITLLNEELHNLYAPRNIIRVIKLRRVFWAMYVARMGEMRDAYKILAERPDGRIWKENIRVDLREIWWETVDWIHLAWDRDQ
jgi:hypothetical protein